MTQEVYRATARAYRDSIRKAKAVLEFNLVRDVKGDKKGFCKYLNSKRKVREYVSPLLNGAEELVTEKRLR